MTPVSQGGEARPRIGIVGAGSFVPAQIVTNFDLEDKLDTDDEWIRSRTGIRERRIARDDESTSDLAVAAAGAALADAGITGADVDLIVVATCTPDMLMPSVGTMVQRELGAGAAAAFDINAACAGFTFALEVASQMMRGGQYRYAIVIGAEVMSRTLDWTDRSTAVLFGDGAGAVVLGQVESGGILGSVLHADGSGIPHLYIPGGGFKSDQEQSGARRAMIMNGREVYRFAVNVMGQSALEALERFGIPVERVALFIPHQANIRIIESAAKHMDLSMDKVYVNVDRYGNTSAASVPLALDEAYRSGRINLGDIVVTVGFGAGLTWGANVIEWSKAMRAATVR
jgi:3-oxoacyl-[acyl-carrier-protein] synthase III